MDDKDQFYDDEESLAYFDYIAGLATVILGWIAVVCFVKLGTRQGLQWKQAYFNALSHKSAKWFDKHSTADLGNTFESDCDAIEHAVGEKLMLIISAAALFIASWVVSFCLSIELSLIFFMMLPLPYASHLIVQISQAKSIKESQELYQTADSIALESLEGIKTVSACNAQKVISEKYKKQLKALKKTTTEMGIATGFGWGTIFCQIFLFTGLAYYVTAVLLDDGYEEWNENDLDAETVFVICFALGLSNFYLNICLPCLGSVYAGHRAACKIADLLKGRKKNTQSGQKIPLNIQGSISFERVHFAYPSRPDISVLQAVSFKVAPGEGMVVVGETGAGKSTLLQLIVGFYRCAEGSVMIDGVDIKEYDIAVLREYIGLVSQEPVLFSGSVRDNIKIGWENASYAEIEAAAEKAEAREFIEALPQGYDTPVGVRGSGLSAGQKQRIAIARVVIRKPKILLLDEIASALDRETEQSIQATLEKIMKGTTSVIVTQNLSTIQNSQQVLVLDLGRVIESDKESYLKTLQQGPSETRQHSLPSKSPTPFSNKPPALKEEFSEYPKDSLSLFARVLSMLNTYWFWLSLSLFSALLSGASIPIFSFLLADCTNIMLGLTGDNKSSDIETNFFYFIWTSLGVLAGLTLMCASLGRLAALFAYDLRHQTFLSLLVYDHKFHDQAEASPALLSSRLSQDCEKMSRLAGPVLGIQVLVTAGLVGGIVIALAYDAVLAMVIIAFLPFIFVAATKADELSARGLANGDCRKTAAITADTFGNIKTVQAFNRQGYFYKQYMEASRTESGNVVGVACVNGVVFGLRYTIMYCLWGTVAVFGAYRVREGDMEMEDMLIVFFCAFFTYIGFLCLTFLVPDVRGGIQGGKNLFKIMDYTCEINVTSSEGYYGPIEGNIEFNQVDFKYPGRDCNVLSSLSFCVRAGGRLGITGPTGAGKSTIGHLLLRFYDPIAGEVLLDSMPLKNYNIRHLRNTVGWVAQEPLLFSGSILENLQLVMPSLTREAALEVLNKAQAGDVVEACGLDAEVGTRGNKLSAGQKQKIALARALIREPMVMILDEATSALDLETEEKIMESVMGERFALIFITHRLQTLKNFEQIVFIQKGTVAEIGSHSELMQNENGLYRELFQKSGNQ